MVGDLSDDVFIDFESFAEMVTGTRPKK